MKELMIHVEQIVRPVRAFAPRKLRMRIELLSHLQAALDEERAVDGNEAAALERARKRLGEADELTQTLQQSVPWIERRLMSRLPIPHAVERWEIRSVNWRKDCPLTLMQLNVLIVGATIFPFPGCLIAALGSPEPRIPSSDVCVVCDLRKIDCRRRRRESAVAISTECGIHSRHRGPARTVNFAYIGMREWATAERAGIAEVPAHRARRARVANTRRTTDRDDATPLRRVADSRYRRLTLFPAARLRIVSVA